MQVEIVGLDGAVFSGKASFVVMPTETGEIGVLPGHTYLGGRIRSGNLRVHQEEGREPFSVFVSGGVFDVTPTQVVVMVDVFAAAPSPEKGKEMFDLSQSIADARVNRLDFSSVQLDTNDALVRAESFYKMKKDLSGIAR
jgi:F-type H+-transporting ATPase subunit epsilon